MMSGLQRTDCKASEKSQPPTLSFYRPASPSCRPTNNSQIIEGSQIRMASNYE